jgi:hypothetical protein
VLASILFDSSATTLLFGTPVLTYQGLELLIAFAMGVLLGTWRTYKVRNLALLVIGSSAVWFGYRLLFLPHKQVLSAGFLPNLYGFIEILLILILWIAVAMASGVIKVDRRTPRPEPTPSP